MNAVQALRCTISAAALAGLLPTMACAAPILPSQLAEPCSVHAVTITRIEKSPLDGVGVLYTGSQGATRCRGLFSGDDTSGSLSAPRPNVGLLHNGLLNGQGGVLDPVWFNDATAPSPLLDLHKNGSYTDPGWLYLGKADRQGRSFGMAPYSKPLKLADVVNVQFQCTGAGDSACTQGNWSLQTSLDLIEKMRAALCRNGFDHLALVLQASDRFAIYDFDFKRLSAGMDGLDDLTPYAFTGTWNTRDFLDKNGKRQNVSHISVWVRGPMPTEVHEVPEPGAAFLFVLGLAGVAVARRRTARQAQRVGSGFPSCGAWKRNRTVASTAARAATPRSHSR